MDEIDEQIVDMLIKDARTSFRKIAKEVGRSPDTVINRFQRLRDEGIVRGSTVVIEPKKINYEGMAAFHIDVSTTGGSNNNSDKIIKTIIKMPNIIVATKTVGDHDLLAIGVIHNFEHLMRLGREIATIPGVQNIQTALWAIGGEINHRYFII